MLSIKELVRRLVGVDPKMTLQPDINNLQWVTYTPAVTADFGAFTTVSTDGTYLVLPSKLIFFKVSVDFTDIGTTGGATQIFVTKPTVQGDGSTNVACVVYDIGSPTPRALTGQVALFNDGKIAIQRLDQAPAVAYNGAYWLISGWYPTL